MEAVTFGLNFISIVGNERISAAYLSHPESFYNECQIISEHWSSQKYCLPCFTYYFILSFALKQRDKVGFKLQLMW